MTRTEIETVQQIERFSRAAIDSLKKGDLIKAYDHILSISDQAFNAIQNTEADIYQCHRCEAFRGQYFELKKWGME